MSFGPTYLPELDSVVQEGRGIASSILGRLFDVYRYAPNATKLYGTDPLYVDYQAYLKKTANRNVIENITFDLVTSIATCDTTILQLGDLLVTTGLDGAPESWCFAQREPMREALFTRVEFTATLRRNSIGPGSIADQPDTGSAFTGYAGRSDGTDRYLGFVNATLAFGGSSTAIQIPCGLQPQNRSRGAHESEIPSSTEHSRYCAYLPPLGIKVEENDEIVIAGDAYLVRQTFESQVGFVGNILIVEKQNE